MGISLESFSENEWNGYVSAIILTGILNMIVLFATIDQVRFYSTTTHPRVTFYIFSYILMQMTNYMRSTRRNVSARRAPHKMLKMGSCCSCRLDFRKSVFLLAMISLLLKLGWYIDPVGLHGLYPHPLRRVVLRLSQACLLECIAMMGLMWRRLAVAQSKFQKIKSIIVIGKYKAELLCLSLLLLAMVSVSIVGAVGVQPATMETITQALFGAFMIILFILSYYASKRLKRTITSGQSRKNQDVVVVDQDPETLSFKEQALDFFRKKKKNRGSYINSGKGPYISDPQERNRRGSALNTGNPINTEAGAQSHATRPPTTNHSSVHNHSRKEPSDGVSKLETSMKRALGIWIVAGALWGVAFLTDRLIAGDDGEISEPLGWWIAYFSILRFVEVLSTMGVLLSIGTRSKRTPRWEALTLDTLCGWACFCFVRCHSNLNDGILSNTASRGKRCQVKLLNTIGKWPGVEAASSLKIEGKVAEAAPFSKTLEPNLRNRLKYKSSEVKAYEHRSASGKHQRFDYENPVRQPVGHDTNIEAAESDGNSSNRSMNAKMHTLTTRQKVDRTLGASSSQNTLATNPARTASVSSSVASGLTEESHVSYQGRNKVDETKRSKCSSVAKDSRRRSSIHRPRRNSCGSANRPPLYNRRTRETVGGTRISARETPGGMIPQTTEPSDPPNRARVRTVSGRPSAQTAFRHLEVSKQNLNSAPRKSQGK